MPKAVKFILGNRNSVNLGGVTPLIRTPQICRKWPKNSVLDEKWRFGRKIC